MRVVRLSDGRVLYAHNPERLFVPASNMKLFTTALALSKLGADYRLTTQIGSEVPIDATGTFLAIWNWWAEAIRVYRGANIRIAATPPRRRSTPSAPSTNWPISLSPAV